MIATVRIAPLEHWCAEGLGLPAEKEAMPKLVGREVPIEIQALHTSPWCGAKAWMVPRDFVADLRAEVETSPSPLEDVILACEHFLELD